MLFEVGEHGDGIVGDFLLADFANEFDVFLAVDVFSGGDFAVDEGGFDGALEAFEGAIFKGVDEGDGLAFLARAAGAADAVDVALLVEGHVVVEDVCDAGDVEAASGDVGGDEHFEFSVFESADDVLPLSLFDVAVEGAGLTAASDEDFAEFIGFAAGAAEKDGLVGLFGIDDADDGVESFGFLDDVERLLHVGVGGVLLDEVDGDGLLEDVLGEFADGGGHSGGEEECLAFFGEEFEDGFDVVHEAHVEHFVGFVEDDGGGREISHAAGFEMVEESAGGCDDDLAATVDEFELAATGLAAIDGDGADLGDFAEAEEFVADLSGEFTGGGDDEDFDACR